MITRSLDAIKVGFAAAVSLLATAQTLAEAPLPGAPISYLELTEDGPSDGSGRPLVPEWPGATFGIDINSQVKIGIDHDQLWARVVGKDQQEFRQRSKDLKARATELRNVIALAKTEVIALKEIIERANRQQVSRKDISRSALNRLDIFNAIKKARALRQGLDPDARVGAGDPLNDMLNGTGPGGYDWRMVGDVLNEELRLIQGEIDSLSASQDFGLAIQAHLISKGGTSTPAYLPGYNTAQTGLANRYEALRFSSTEQTEAFHQYEALAKDIEASKNLGESVIKQLEVELRMLVRPFREVASASEDATVKLRDRLKALEKWGESDHRARWIMSVEKHLGDVKGAEVKSAWDKLSGGFLSDLGSELAMLRAMANLRPELDGRSGAEAIRAILTTVKSIDELRHATSRLLNQTQWNRWRGQVDEFIAAIDQLGGPAKSNLLRPGGPVADLKEARNAFEDFSIAVQADAPKVVAWLTSYFASPVSLAANLPIPPGHRVRAVSGAPILDTRIDLQRIPSPRQPGDLVRLSYDYYRGSDRIGGRSDDLILRSFGWNSEVLASLAFTRPTGGEAAWKPTAAMNWILSHSPWPKGQEQGLRESRLKWFSGAGVSVMPLDSDGTEGVKIGVAATVALLNNRVLLGYGGNLQDPSNKGFLFFSIRLLDFPGLSGPIGTATPNK